ncbi:hypothetical protein Tco_0227291, partial [Tanacetum coccineum]
YLRLFQGKDACLDVTGISPFAGMGANSWAPAVALLMRWKKKKYASICEDNGYKFIPFAFSTFGEFDMDALNTLLRHLSRSRLGCAKKKVATWNDLAVKIIILGWNVALKRRLDGRN